MDYRSQEHSMGPDPFLRNDEPIIGMRTTLVDVSTQVDLAQEASGGGLFSCGGDDDGSKRKGSRKTPIYSKEDIREQYCITQRQLNVLERGPRGLFGVGGPPLGGGGLFGCLSNYQESTCHRSSLLSVCLRGEEPTEEYESGVFRRKRRGVGDGWGNSRDLAPAPRWRYPHHEIADDERRPRSFCADPKRFTWLSEDEEATPRMERPRPIRVEEEEAVDAKRFTGDPGEEEDDEEEQWYTGRGRRRLYQTLSQSSEYIGECPAHPVPPPPPPPAKHVSFDARSLVRSQTVTSFEGVQSSRERLIDGRKDTVAVSPVLAKAIFMEKIKRATMKTQATQTDMWKAAIAAVVADGRFTVPRRHPPHHHKHEQHQSALSLSPRTVHRVSRASEAPVGADHLNDISPQVEMVSQGAQTNGVPRRLTKSLSEAGPRQIAQPQTPPPPPSPHEPLHRAASEGVEGRKRLGSGNREIFIDFEPQGGRALHKTMSEGEVRRHEESSAPGGLGGTFPRMQRLRGSHHPLVQAPSDADSIITIEEDEFHENLVVSGFFRKRSLSLEEVGKAEAEGEAKEEKVLEPTKKTSPFVSMDSLTGEGKDHSDSIWNESQATVLQANAPASAPGASPSGVVVGFTLSDSESGTLASVCSELSGPNNTTPSSRRRQMLMVQHQQRSSVDTEALEDEGSVEKEEVPSIGDQVCTERPVTPPKPTKARVARRRGKARRMAAHSSDDDEPPKDEIKEDKDVDKSETSEDYVTATESSGGVVAKVTATKGDGSSFESASSMYSLVRGEAISEDSVQLSVSPPAIVEEEGREEEDVPFKPLTANVACGTSSPEDRSSSSGSYSLEEGLEGRERRIRRKRRRRVGNDEVEGVSPTKDALDQCSEWGDEEKNIAKKGLRLEFASDAAEDEDGRKHRGYRKKCSKSGRREEARRHPRASLRKAEAGMVRSPAMPDGFREGYSTEEEDEGHRRRPRRRSSGGSGGSPGSSLQRCRESGRRRTPDEGQPRVLVSGGSVEKPTEESPATDLSHLSPHRFCKSPSGKGSPKQGTKTSLVSPESSRLMALSAESLRSVSPGSDSVFYGAEEEEPLCRHCGEAVSPPRRRDKKRKSPLRGLSSSDPAMDEILASGDIVLPPAGFADSPEGQSALSPSYSYPGAPAAPARSGRLYKKLDKRFRSEERRRHRPKGVSGAPRAKSEERDGGDETRSRMKRSQSSQSVGAAICSRDAGEGEEVTEAVEGSKGEEANEDCTVGVSTECYKSVPWIYIGDTEELRVWQRRVVADLSKYRHQSASSQKNEEDEKRDESPTGSVESTNSERDFRRKYQAITHRMVHRKSSVEMYRRLASKSFAKEPEEWSLRKSAQQLLRKMLLVWCRETMAIGLLPHHGGESDKRVVVRRERGGEFGFRIHGSRPVVVSAIEAGTPAESSGLEVGDIVLSVNGTPVLDASHSEVVKIAHAGSDTLELEVARTCDVLTPVLRTSGLDGMETEWSDLEGVTDMLLAGFLWKMVTSGTGIGKWHRRWFTLRRNHCLYYYKSEEEVQPLGALSLSGYSVEILESKKEIVEGGEEASWEPTYVFKVWRRGALGLTLGSESTETGNQWSKALAKAIEKSSQGDSWLEQVERWVGLGPGAITRPDCFGYLSYLMPSEERSSSVGGTGRRRGKSGSSAGGTGEWKRRYCVLKDACLFFYEDVDSRVAVGMACLHGYRVQSSSPASGPSGAGKRLFAFEVLPPLAPSPPSDHHHHHHHGHHRHHTMGQRHALPYHQKHFHFHTDTEMDKKRWLAALEYSIDRWIKVG